MGTHKRNVCRPGVRIKQGRILAPYFTGYANANKMNTGAWFEIAILSQEMACVVHCSSVIKIGGVGASSPIVEGGCLRLG